VVQYGNRRAGIFDFELIELMVPFNLKDFKFLQNLKIESHFSTDVWVQKCHIINNVFLRRSAIFLAVLSGMYS